MFAEQGISLAQFNLGTMYKNGEGVPEDYREAVKWFRLSAEQGHESGQYNLGGGYHFGNGVPKDYVLAYMWYNLAASNGFSGAGILRDIVEKEMTSNQIAEAQKLARECVAKSYKGC
ncbi:MAG: sel1 repeat family protein [Proteobacteria bacterium]|nr:sel1 repeat family protein [Pseudomonadota bacterium]